MPEEEEEVTATRPICRREVEWNLSLSGAGRVCNDTLVQASRARCANLECPRLSFLRETSMDDLNCTVL